MSDAPARVIVPYGAEPRAAARPIRVGTPGRWPLLFIAASLVALAVVPAVLGQRIASAEDWISQHLEPARELSAELTLVHSRQMSRFQGYLLTGDPAYRVRYFALRERESGLSEALDERVRPTHVRLRERLAVLSSGATRWQINHAYALEGDAQRRDYLGQVQDEQRRYDEVLAAAQELSAAIDAEIQVARGAVDRARELQTRLTVALTALALFATIAVAGIGRRLRALVAEAERRRGDALKARREMEAVVEATGDGVLGVDLEGRCTNLNATGSRLLGYAEVEALGRDVHDLVHGRAPEGRTHSLEACPILVALTSGEGGRETEDVFWRRDGSAFHGKWHLRPLREGRLVRGGVLTLTDMTEIRTAEAALKQAVHARDQVVAVVSHDLRNPVGTVSAASELLLEMDLPEDRREEQLRIIRRTAERMNRLIEDLLDVSRIEGGGLAVEPRPLEVEPLVREAVELQAPQAGERGIQLVSDVRPGLPPVLGDPHRILQVFSNLLANAFQHTLPGGRVTVSARPGEGQVVLSVLDTGGGIAPEDLARLFDRFWQARRTGRSGAGLGLAIVKGIVEAHGGRVWAESEPGGGSAFHFTLPAYRESDVGDVPAWPAVPISEIFLQQGRARA